MSRRVALHSTLAAIAAIAVYLFLVSGLDGEAGISDTGVYQRYGERIAAGDLPYRDFVVEYPPGALAPFVIPALVTSTRGGYDAAFRTAMMFALAAACVLIVLALEALQASTRRVALSVGAFLAGIVLLGPFVLTRFDLYAAAVTLAAVCAVLHRRRHLGPTLLGVAIATKIYPAVLLPLVVTRIWRHEGRGAALRGLGLAAGTAVAIYLPFAIVTPEGVLRSLWRQVGRPLQIESLGSGVLLALHHGFGMPLDWASSAGSQNLTGTVASVASAVTTLASLAALVLVWVRFARGDTDERRSLRPLRRRRDRGVRGLREGRLAAVPRLAPRRRGARRGSPGSGRNGPLARCLRRHPTVVPTNLLGSGEAVRSHRVVARARARSAARGGVRSPDREGS